MLYCHEIGKGNPSYPRHWLGFLFNNYKGGNTLFDDDDGKLDLTTFMWFRDNYEVCNSDPSQLLDLIRHGGSIGYEYNLKSDKKYDNSKYKELHKERMEYMDSLYKADLLRQKKKANEWIISIKDCLYRFSNYLGVSVKETLKLLDKNICAMVKVDDNEFFIKLNHYQDRFSARFSTYINDVKINICVFYYADESWQVRTHNRLQPVITDVEPNGFITDTNGNSYPISASFLISLKMEKIIERVRYRYYE